MKRVYLHLPVIIMLVFIHIGIFSQDDVPVKVFDGKELITVDFRDTDIKDVLRVIADTCKTNIVASNNVKGKITMSLKDVTLQDALEAILTVNNFAWKLKGDIILVESIPNMITEFIQLNYADGSEIRELISSMKSETGSILMDTRSNKFIIKDYPENIKEIKKVISELDLPTSQVTINAKIIDINVSDAIDLGLKLGFNSYDGNPDGDKKTISNGFTLSEDEESGRETSYTTQKGRASGYGVNLRPSDSDGTFDYDYNNFRQNDYTISDISSVGTLTTSVISAALSDVINVQLDALISKGKSLLLASPTITTLNNETASIIIGDKVGIKEQTQTTTGTTETVRFQDIGTKLEVTPQINSDGYITMKIKPEISSIVDYTQDTIQFRTREAKTKVRVRDGQTVIIGGLIKNEESISSRRVPFLSRIPILGIPFRGKYNSGEQTELVVFLTPKILRIDDLNEVSKKNSNELLRDNEARAKEEEMMKKFTYNFEPNKTNRTGIHEDKSLSKKLYKEALKLKRKAKRMDDERKIKIYDIAIEKFYSLMNTYPESEYIADSLYHLSEIYEQKGQKDLALNSLNEIIEKYPNEDIYKKAKRKKDSLIN